MNVTHLYRYPFKGLSPEALGAVQLTADQGFPVDRYFALARHDAVFDQGRPAPLPKTEFLMLMKDEKLAALNTRFDEQKRLLTVRDAGGPTLVSAVVDTAEGRARIEAFFHAFLGDSLQGPPRLVQAQGHQFTDVSVVSSAMMRSISLINLASVRALEAATGETVNPLRFRANIYFDNNRPWSEFDWMDKEIALGTVPMQVVHRIRRCAATQVNPDTAERDVNVPRHIKDHFGHTDLGIYAQVKGDGVVTVGDAVTAP